MERIHIIAMFIAALVIASCDPAPATTKVQVMKTKSGQLCGRTESSQWYCTKG